jgi:hypothetical protein
LGQADGLTYTEFILELYWNYTGVILVSFLRYFWDTSGILLGKGVHKAYMLRGKASPAIMR